MKKWINVDVFDKLMLNAEMKLFLLLLENVKDSSYEGFIDPSLKEKIDKQVSKASYNRVLNSLVDSGIIVFKRGWYKFVLFEKMKNSKDFDIPMMFKK
jgi:hypothetical protein